MPFFTDQAECEVVELRILCAPENRRCRHLTDRHKGGTGLFVKCVCRDIRGAAQNLLLSPGEGIVEAQTLSCARAGPLFGPVFP